jgi:pimeloyl-ACP methyl ester carboxylesterase
MKELLMAGTLRAWRVGCFVSQFAAAWLLAGVAAADIVTLKNGVTLDGSPAPISSLKADPLSGAGETGLKQILVVDNQLTRTFVPTKQIAKEFGKPPAVSTERIPLVQRVPTSGQQISVVGMPLRIDPFDEYGHRIFSMVGPKGKPYDLVQGITEITPRWTKVEAIEGINHYLLAMRIATSSIPREQLSKILTRALNAKDPTQRLRIVRLYLQSERFKDARLELEQLIKEFPALADLEKQRKELRQLEVQRLLKEIELRQSAGQYRLVVAMLDQFPAEGVAGETLIKVREMLDEIRGQQEQGHKVLKLLAEHAAELKAEATREGVKGIVTEIKSDLNINTLDRMADYLRLADDAKMSAEQKMSLAISGWLLGSGAAIDNLGVSLSLVKVRDLVRQYMVTTRQPERDNILSQLTSQEAATNNYIAAILAHMKPPVETAVLELPKADVGDPAALLGLPGEESARPKEVGPNEGKPANKNDDPGFCAPKDDDSALLKGAPAPAGTAPKSALAPAAADAKPAEKAPAAAQATETPGLYAVTVKTNLPEDPQVKYWVQLPPEYDPYRRYPCIVTLNGKGTTPLQQIDWWAGDYNAEANTRYGQATRHGYIVLAPQWTREHQQQYEFSAREHAAVLLPLRDACKRFSIAVDRVFLTGHSMGGTAAWDIGLAHPDLWAGMIPIVATPGKYVTQYWENGKYVPMYFVCGEKDTATYACFGDWDRYLMKVGYDAMVVQYLGRGHESFFDEIQNLFTWMNLHKREFFPKEFKVQSLRPWDNFFWWVETGDPKEINMILPAEWGDNPTPAKTPRPAETKTSPLAPNGLSVTSGSCGKVRVWLAPELVTFNDTLKVVINGKRHLKIQPRIETLLEDVRTRGDRQHPFWAKVEN